VFIPEWFHLEKYSIVKKIRKFFRLTGALKTAIM